MGDFILVKLFYAYQTLKNQNYFGITKGNNDGKFIKMSGA